MKKNLCALAACIILTAPSLSAQSTAFTYQGRLNDGGGAADGVYEMQFKLYSAGVGGGSLTTAVTNKNMAISNGFFTVILDWGSSVFDGNPRFLEIGVRTNGSSSSFSLLTPRQAITATPYAVRAATLSGGGLSGAYSGAVALTNTLNSFAGSYTGNGGGLTNMNASQLAGPIPLGSLSNAWKTTGNSGTTPGTHFLGTTDYQPFEIRAGRRGWRLEPAAYGTVNIIGGSETNSVKPDSRPIIGATIGGGGATNYFGVALPNSISGDFGTISGGASNTVLGHYSMIGGGSENTVYWNGVSAVIGGGFRNFIGSQGWHATIGGGLGNLIKTAAEAGTIAGGENNSLGESAQYSTIGGGIVNTIGNGATDTVIAGGALNSIQGSRNVISGGYGNAIGYGDSSVIGGGYYNTIRSNGAFASIPGGWMNSAAGCAFAAGVGAQADHLGAFVWADHRVTANNVPIPFSSTGTNEFSVRASGGVRLVTSIDATGSVTAGVTVAPGSGTWSSLSDRNAKENFAAANGREILDKVAALPLASWNYKAQDKSVRHLGPMAQEFHAAFGLGENDRTIATVDADGVALAAIQGLNQKLEENLKQKETEITELKTTVAELKELVERMAQGRKGGER